MDIKITIVDREGQAHKLEAPTDMAMNLMEVCKAYELPVEGTFTIVVSKAGPLHTTVFLSM